MTSTEFVPRVPILSQVLIQLKDSPHIRLVVLLVLRVYCIEFACGARRGKEGGIEERREAGKGAFEGGGPDVEVIIGISCAGICIGGPIVLCQELRGSFEP